MARNLICYIVVTIPKACLPTVDGTTNQVEDPAGDSLAKVINQPHAKETT